MKKVLIAGFIIFLFAAGIYLLIRSQSSITPVRQISNKSVLPTKSADYNPKIDPVNFVSKIDNKYHNLKPGTKFTYSEKTKDGMEKIEIVVNKDTKQVLGVTTTMVRDTVWLDNVIKEDTVDLYAQDKEGNVWYFGEAVNNYENGKLMDHKGSWEAGVDGAKPGIAMEANPKVGDSYRQEYYKGIAEDMGDIVAVDKKVTVPFGTFENCLQTRDWSKIEPQLNENKYYCPQVGFLTAGDSVKEPGTEKLELLTVINP